MIVSKLSSNTLERIRYCEKFWSTSVCWPNGFIQKTLIFDKEFHNMNTKISNFDEYWLPKPNVNLWSFFSSYDEYLVNKRSTLLSKCWLDKWHFKNYRILMRISLDCVQTINKIFNIPFTCLLNFQITTYILWFLFSISLDVSDMFFKFIVLFHS